MCRMKKLRVHISGLTLVELLVTLSIAAILVVIAVPSLNDSQTRRKIAGEQRDLKLDLAFARSEAVSRNEYVSICSSDDGLVCRNSDDWSDGWIIFVDDGEGVGAPKDSIRGTAEELLRVYEYDDDTTALSAYDVDNAGVQGLTFSARGYLDVVQRGLPDRSPKRLTFRLCGPTDPGGLEDFFGRGVLLDVTGRALDSFDRDLNGIYEDIEHNDFDC